MAYSNNGVIIMSGSSESRKRELVLSRQSFVEESSIGVGSSSGKPPIFLPSGRRQHAGDAEQQLDPWSSGGGNAGEVALARLQSLAKERWALPQTHSGIAVCHRCDSELEGKCGQAPLTGGAEDSELILGA